MKHPFLVNIVLALAWAAVVGRFTLATLVVGYLVGYVAIFLSTTSTSGQRYGRKTWILIRFVGFYSKEIVLASLRVAYDVLTPRPRARPAVLAIPLEEHTDAEVTLLANLLTMTPGTLSLDVSKDKRTLYIHAMFVDDVEAFRRSIKDGLERRVMEVMR